MQQPMLVPDLHIHIRMQDATVHCMADKDATVHCLVDRRQAGITGSCAGRFIPQR